MFSLLQQQDCHSPPLFFWDSLELGGHTLPTSIIDAESKHYFYITAIHLFAIFILYYDRVTVSIVLY
jgi:hypothetical protein